jgi:hypothetical protein
MSSREYTQYDWSDSSGGCSEDICFVSSASIIIYRSIYTDYLRNENIKIKPNRLVQTFWLIL